MVSFFEREEFFKNKDLTYCRDSLTGVFNRTTINEYVSYLMDNNRPFSYLVCDLDNFKFVNDSFGHTVGDEVLKKCSDGLVKLSLENGVVGRFGGDEFLVVVPDIVEYDEIWKVCRRLVFESNRLDIEELKGNNISFTIGMSRFPIDGDKFEVLMKKADTALYRGKQKGRNCFIIYLDEKHANIKITDSGAKSFNNMDMHSRIGKILTNSEDIKENIKNLSVLLSSILMIDHFCIQSKTRIVQSNIHSLCDVKEFEFIDSELLFRTTNASGFCIINNIETLLNLNFNEIYDEFYKQHVTAVVFVKIEAYNQFFGYIRADSAKPDGRIWQMEDVNLLIMFAKLLGTILYFKHTNLDELD